MIARLDTAKTLFQNPAKCSYDELLEEGRFLCQEIERMENIIDSNIENVTKAFEIIRKLQKENEIYGKSINCLTEVVEKVNSFVEEITKEVEKI